MGWDDKSENNGYLYQCGANETTNPRFDIFSFSLGNQTDSWLSVDSKDYIALLRDFRVRKSLKKNLLIASNLGGGLERITQTRYKIIFIYLYKNQEDYSRKLDKVTFAFYDAKLAGKPTPINIYGFPLAANVFTFTYQSARYFEK